MSVKFSNIEFSPKEGKKINLITAEGVFNPNTTSELLIKAVKRTIDKPKKMIDLGCGTGVVGLSLWLEGLVIEPICASDLSEISVTCSKQNFKKFNCAANVRCGSLFEPWRNEKFDIILDDISGISQEIAPISPWFEGVPCETGTDGTGLVIDIIRNASKHLKKNGHFFFPVLSLSNVDSLLLEVKNNFASVELLERQEWPLPKELEVHIPLLKKLSKIGSIKLEERFGMVLCYTEVYQARNPINQLK